MEELTLRKISSVLPLRKPDSHKGTFGKVLAVCGSSYYRGAAALSCEGALRTGAGIVCLASPEEVIESIASRIPEAIFLPMPNDMELLERCRKYNSVLIGCGLIEGGETLLRTKQVLEASCGTVVVDASALNSISCNLNLLKSAYERVIITPHIGEMSRLTGLTPRFIGENMEKCAVSFALEYGVTVVLKSHRTVISSPDGETFINTTGNAGLARGGSGDILSGMIASFAAQGLSPLESAQCGVFLHGLAADRTARRKSMAGMLPHDIFEDLGSVFLEIES